MKNQYLKPCRMAFPGVSAIMPILVCFFFFASGCSKEQILPAGDYALDNNIYFTIQVESYTYTSKGFYKKSAPTIYDGPRLSFKTHQDSSGNSVTDINILVNSILADCKINSGTISNCTSVFVGNCNLNMGMTKSGMGLIGTYQKLVGDDPLNVINDISQNRYVVDTSGLSFIISREGKHTNGAWIAEGSFSCNVFHSNRATLIPATGTFRVYEK